MPASSRNHRSPQSPSGRAAQLELLPRTADPLRHPQASTPEPDGRLTSNSDHRDASQTIPQPQDRPTLQLWPQVGKILGLGRAATYEAARRGDIPTIRFGRRLVVPTAALRRLLAIDTGNP